MHDQYMYDHQYIMFLNWYFLYSFIEKYSFNSYEMYLLIYQCLPSQAEVPSMLVENHNRI